MEQDHTIFALSSGHPPAALAVVRISGPKAGAALRHLSGRNLPPARRAVVRALRDQAGALLDQALVLWLPGPKSATGEDMVELHLHGGRAVVAAVLAALAAIPGLVPAQGGQFTRRALEHGRLDLAEAEGLGDLLTAETEAQRRQALALYGGALSRQTADWQDDLLLASALVESQLDFADEDDVARDGDGDTGQQPWEAPLRALGDAMAQYLATPPAERLRDGVTVAIAGPPNAGKSTLINALSQRDAAITSPIAGTTRDIVEVPVALSGVAFRLLDTAGVRTQTDDPIEQEGIARAQAAMASADLLLWLGAAPDAPEHPGLLRLYAQADQRPPAGPDYDLALSAKTGAGVPELIALLVARAETLLPRMDTLALNDRQRRVLHDVHDHVAAARTASDPLIVGEHLRLARQTLDQLTGRAGTEDMLDALFGRFCIGK